VIELVAPAKLTWYFEITGRRDDGYHLIRSEMVTLDFADRLHVDESEDYLRLSSPRDDVPLDGPTWWRGLSNWSLGKPA